MIGGDVDASGAATRHFSGEINDVRLVEESPDIKAIDSIFQRNDSADDDTIALLEFGISYGRLHPDESSNQAHGFGPGTQNPEPPRSWMVEDW